MSEDKALDTAGNILGIERQIPARNLPVAGSDAIAKAANGKRRQKRIRDSRRRAREVPNQNQEQGSAFSPQGVPVNGD